MLSAIRCSLMLVAVAAVVPAAFHPEALAGHRRCCCRVCQNPVAQCVCVAPTIPMVPQTTYQPIVETQYAQQPVLQQRDVLMTEYRSEPVTETVPRTIYENVLVDEGSYQTVWVPRVTTKSVAKTVYQTQTAYRTVPYQVSRRISEYATQTVPYQTVRYAPVTGGSLAYGVPGYAVSALPYGYPLPAVAAAPVLSAPVVPSPSATAGRLAPINDPRFATQPATPVGPRGALSYDERPSATSTADRGPALFSPAPSAAQVWRTPRGTVTR
jgi:hypothetical protein